MRVLNRRALRLRVTSALLLATALAAGCTTPAGHPALEQADAAVERARRSPRVRALAPAELDRAEVALQEARDAARAGASPDQVGHLVYIVSQRASLAEARAAQQVARSEIQMLEGALDQVFVRGRLGPGRQRQASFPARDRQPRAPVQVHPRGPLADDQPAHSQLQPPRQAGAPLHEVRQAQSPGQAEALLQESRHALAPPQEHQQPHASPPEPQPALAPLQELQQVSGSMGEARGSPGGPGSVGQAEDVAAAAPDPLAADIGTSPQEITLSLAQLSFAGAEPTSETDERLAAVAEQLLRESERSVAIKAEFNLPDPAARTMLEQRVEIVRAILLRRGVAPERVVVRASGDGPEEPRATPSLVEAPY
jgi:hypothetical protein